MYSLYRQYLLIVFAVGFLSSILLFNGCKSNNESSSEVRFEKLDSIEAQMFQEPENLDSLIEKVDTMSITDLEQARINTIKALHFYTNEEYGKSIQALEEAESYYLNHGDDFHNNVNQLVKAFNFEYLDLDDIAAKLYIECEDYFNKISNLKYKFYASLGVLRMSKQLNLDQKFLFNRMQVEFSQLNDLNYNGLLFATMGVLEKDDSIKNIYYEHAKSDFSKLHRWSRVYAIELNNLFWQIRQNKVDNIQSYYDSFNNRSYSYIPTNQQKMRYQYGQAYLYSIQGKDQQAIKTATHVLDQTVSLHISKVEFDCLQLLAYLYRKTGDFKKAHAMLERYHYLKEKAAGGSSGINC